MIKKEIWLSERDLDEGFEIIIEASAGFIGRFAQDEDGTFYLRVHGNTGVDTEIELNDEGDLKSFASL